MRQAAAAGSLPRQFLAFTLVGLVGLGIDAGLFTLLTGVSWSIAAARGVSVDDLAKYVKRVFYPRRQAVADFEGTAAPANETSTRAFMSGAKRLPSSLVKKATASGRRVTTPASSSEPAADGRWWWTTSTCK